MTFNLPKHLRNASPERIFAYRSKNARKAKQSSEDCRSLFRQRMQRDGRERELDKLIAKYREEGKSRRQAIYAAMREMGYEGADKERAYEGRAIADAMMNRRRQKLRDGQKRHYRRMKNKALDEVMDTLKPNAPPEQEMDWVLSHRKLFHASLQADDDDPVKLTADDIRNAPSQAAVTMLATAIKNPDGWMEKKRDANKAKTSAGSGGDDDNSDVVDDLSEVERMLKAATSEDG
jgi:hypothetical protein